MSAPSYFELLKENAELKRKLDEYESKTVQAQQFKKKNKLDINKEGNQWVIRSFRMGGGKNPPAFVDDTIVQRVYKNIQTQKQRQLTFPEFALLVIQEFNLPFKNHMELFANRKYYHNYYNKPLKVLAALELIVYHNGLITKKS